MFQTLKHCYALNRKYTIRKLWGFSNEILYIFVTQWAAKLLEVLEVQKKWKMCWHVCASIVKTRMQLEFQSLYWEKGPKKECLFTLSFNWNSINLKCCCRPLVFIADLWTPFKLWLHHVTNSYFFARQDNLWCFHQDAQNQIVLCSKQNGGLH